MIERATSAAGWERKAFTQSMITGPVALSITFPGWKSPW
jgi:hypothetical protein